MRAAVLHEHGGTPRCAEFAEPTGLDEGVLVDVAAAGFHHLDLLKATGTYYTGPPPLPGVVGTDGVGRLPDGRRVYFDRTVAPYGSMGERTCVPPDAMLDVSDGVSDVVAAALGNTGLAAWTALPWRAGLRPDGRTPLGRAGRGRRHIDLLWGEAGLAAMGAAARFARHVQVGSITAGELRLPASLIRSLSLESVALEDVADAWERQRQAAGGRKLVIIPGAAVHGEESAPT